MIYEVCSGGVLTWNYLESTLFLTVVLSGLRVKKSFPLIRTGNASIWESWIEVI